MPQRLELSTDPGSGLYLLCLAYEYSPSLGEKTILWGNKTCLVVLYTNSAVEQACKGLRCASVVVELVPSSQPGLVCA